MYEYIYRFSNLRIYKDWYKKTLNLTIKQIYTTNPGHYELERNGNKCLLHIIWTFKTEASVSGC